jgi:hypothetical protein
MVTASSEKKSVTRNTSFLKKVQRQIPERLQTKDEEITLKPRGGSRGGLRGPDGIVYKRNILSKQST